MNLLTFLMLLWGIKGNSELANCQLPAPSNFAATEVTCDSIYFSWAEVPGAYTYKIRFRPSSGGSWEVKNVGNTTSIWLTYENEGLVPSVSYDFTVRAFCTAASNSGGAISPSVSQIIPQPCGGQTAPNVIVIYCDDLPNGITSGSGAPSFVETPNIDAIAAQGVTFSRNYAVQPLCAPSRATLTTGHASASTGVMDNSTQANFNLALPTFGSQLKNAGYYTAAVGKFHETIGVHGELDWNYRLESVTNQSVINVKFSLNGGIGKKAGNDSIITKVLMDTAIALVGRVPEPLFLLISLRDPHTPTKVPPPFDHYYDNDVIEFGGDTALFSPPLPSFIYELTNKNYKEADKMVEILKNQYRAMAYVDHRIGDLLAALDAAGKLNGNTMIIFTSDNGFLNDQHGLYGKRWPYRPSAEMPLTIWYEPWFPAGVTSDLLTSNVDLYATILHAAGIIDTQSQGYSIKDLYDGSVFRPVAYHSMAYTTEDNFQGLASSKAVWDEDYKLIQYGCDEPTEQFFDLLIDPDEMNNLINVPELQATIESYRVMLAERAAFYGDTLPGTILDCNLAGVAKMQDSAQGYTDGEISISPNPTARSIMIVGAQGESEIFSSLGEHIGISVASTFDATGLPRGVYFVKSQDISGETIITPFVKQ